VVVEAATNSLLTARCHRKIMEQGAPKATDSAMQSGNSQQRGMHMAAGGWAVTERSGAILILEGYKSSFFSARHFGCSLVSTGLLPDPTRSV